MTRILALLLMVLCTACGDDNIMTDDIGVSNFYFKNASSVDLRFVVAPDSETFDLNSEITLEVDRDVPGGIGIHAKPSDRFQSVRIYLANTDSLVYQQDPVVDSLWQHATPFGAVWWERAEYTLFITDADLALN